MVRLAFRGRDENDVSYDLNRGRRYRRRTSHEARRVVARLVTEEPGLYGVGFQEVFQSSRQPAVASSSLRLSRQGDVVPLHLVPDTGLFGPGTELVFISEGAESNLYGNEAVYELEVGVSGERMATDEAVPSGEAVPYYWELVEKQENHTYQATLLDAPDRWL